MCTTYEKEHAKLSTCIGEDEGSIGWFASLNKNTDFFFLGGGGGGGGGV